MFLKILSESLVIKRKCFLFAAAVHYLCMEPSFPLSACSQSGSAPFKICVCREKASESAAHPSCLDMCLRMGGSSLRTDMFLFTNNKTTSPTIQKDGDKFLPSFSFHKLCSGGYFLFAELSQNACSNQCVMIMILTRSLASQSKRAQHKWALLYLNVVVICIEIKCLLNVCYWQNLISTSVTLVVLFNLFLME